MVFEITLFMIHQPPGLNANFTITTIGEEVPYSLNMLIACLTLFKLVIVCRTFFRYSKWGKMSQ